MTSPFTNTIRDSNASSMDQNKATAIFAEERNQSCNDTEIRIVSGPGPSVEDQKLREIAQLQKDSQDAFGHLQNRAVGGSEAVEVYPEDISDLSEDLHRDYECFSDDGDATARAIQFTEDGDQRYNERLRSLADGNYSFMSKLSPKSSALISQQHSPKSAISKAASARAREKVKKADKPTLGIIYFIIYTFLKAASYVVCQLLYDHDPALKPFQMLFMRSIFGIFLMMIQLNVNVKKETIDGVSRDKVSSLIFKTFTGTTTNMINYSVTKFIPLTIISVVANLAPIIVVVLAFLILKEVIRKFDLLMMMLTLLGIFGVIFGGDNENEDTDETPLFPYFVLYILLMINPFLSAGGTIAMRKMSKFSDSVVSWYMQWSVLISSAIIMAATGLSFTIYGDWDWYSWVLAFLTGATSVYSETMRFKALKL